MNIQVRIRNKTEKYLHSTFYCTAVIIFPESVKSVSGADCSPDKRFRYKLTADCIIIISYICAICDFLIIIHTNLV